MIKITASQYGAVVASILGFAVLTGCKKPTTDIGLEFAQEDLLSLNQTDTLALSLKQFERTAGNKPPQHGRFGQHGASIFRDAPRIICRTAPAERP